MAKVKVFLVTRPRLASKLEAAGLHGTVTVNPWNNRTAWEFELSPELVRISEEFYMSIGKPLPHSLRNYIEGGKE